LDTVKACVHLNQDELQVAEGSKPVLKSFLEYLRPRMRGVFAMKVDLSREFTATAGEPEFLVFADQPKYQSAASIMPPDAHGVVPRASDDRLRPNGAARLEPPPGPICPSPTP
jgi:hypothetical protein